MAAPSVLDVGCGTGRLPHRAREAGHAGRLCGVDPDVAALERGRRRAGIEWVEAGAGVGGLEPANLSDVVDHAGRELRVSHRVESVAGDVVTLTEIDRDPHRDPLRVDGASLRLDVEGIDAFLGDAGFEVEARYGDWSRGPLIGASDNIVTVARAP